MIASGPHDAGPPRVPPALSPAHYHDGHTNSAVHRGENGRREMSLKRHVVQSDEFKEQRPPIHARGARGILTDLENNEQSTMRRESVGTVGSPALTVDNDENTNHFPSPVIVTPTSSPVALPSSPTEASSPEARYKKPRYHAQQQFNMAATGFSHQMPRSPSTNNMHQHGPRLNAPSFRLPSSPPEKQPTLLSIDQYDNSPPQYQPYSHPPPPPPPPDSSRHVRPKPRRKGVPQHMPMPHNPQQQQPRPRQSYRFFSTAEPVPSIPPLHQANLPPLKTSFSASQLRSATSGNSAYYKNRAALFSDARPPTSTFSDMDQENSLPDQHQYQHHHHQQYYNHHRYPDKNHDGISSNGPRRCHPPLPETSVPPTTSSPPQQHDRLLKMQTQSKSSLSSNMSAGPTSYASSTFEGSESVRTKDSSGIEFNNESASDARISSAYSRMSTTDDQSMSVDEVFEMYLDAFAADSPPMVEEEDEVENIGTTIGEEESGLTEDIENDEVSNSALSLVERPYSKSQDILENDDHVRVGDDRERGEKEEIRSNEELEEEQEDQAEEPFEASAFSENLEPVAHHEPSIPDSALPPSTETLTPPPSLQRIINAPNDSSKREKLPPDFSSTPPPPFLHEHPTRDCYGFLKTSTRGIKTADYNAWNATYAPYLETRTRKWDALMVDHGLPQNEPNLFPARSAKMKRYVRKGIPPSYRGAAWFFYAGGHQYLQKSPGLYRRLVERAWNCPMNDDMEHIERDLHRTFPDNIHFKPDTEDEQKPPTRHSAGHERQQQSSERAGDEPSESQIIQSLRRVLYAFSLHNPRIGYTQSLNFIAGMLLLFLTEEKAFWMLHIITAKYLPATHEISLEGANVDLWILMVLLREQMPAVFTKVASQTPTTLRSKPPVITTKTRLPDITLGLTNWLMSIFIGSLPLETTLRAWDIFFFEGSRTFFRISLGIFKTCEKQILGVGDPIEIFQIIQTYPKKLLDANAFINECHTGMKYHRSTLTNTLTQARVDTLRQARRTAIREEKERLSFLGSANPQTRAGAASTRRASRASGGSEDLSSHTTKAGHAVMNGWSTLKSHAFRH